MLHLPFVDRLEAGRLLAAEICRRDSGGNAVVLALSRGGVPVGFAVADRLRLPLDVIVVRKISAPWQRELALGAIAGNVKILDHRMIQEVGTSAEEVESIVVQEEAEMRRREELYRDGKPACDLKGRSAILIDDGLATGHTMLAAIRHTRSLNPARIIVAVPVGSREACARVKEEADDLVCLATPKLFFAVGEWYRQFEQVSDTEVTSLLAQNRSRLETYSCHEHARKAHAL